MVALVSSFMLGLVLHGSYGDIIDVLTSKSSTLPYDDDTMQKMIGLVQSAKGMLVLPRREGLLTL